MRRDRIYITENDAIRLRSLIEEAGQSEYFGSSELRDLATEVKRALVVSLKEMPNDVITMNTTACLADIDTGEEMTYTLVFPDEADFSQGKISVLAPIGTAILGYRVGSTIKWTVPAGSRRFKIVSVLYQPEAAGDYHL